MIADKAIEEVFITIKNHCNITTEDFLNEENCQLAIIDPVASYCSVPFGWAMGASKIVIIPTDSEYVLKIPFNSRVEIEDEEGDGEISYNFDAFECANTSNGWDYCAAECDTYERAWIKHLDACFLQTEFYGTINGWPVYVQRKCTVAFCSEEDPYDSAEKELIRSCYNDNNYYALPFKWAIDFYNYYGETVLRELLSFLREEDLYDFHCNNLGYFNNVPVIFDYGDYRE